MAAMEVDLPTELPVTTTEAESCAAASRMSEVVSPTDLPATAEAQNGTPVTKKRKIADLWSAAGSEHQKMQGFPEFDKKVGGYRVQILGSVFSGDEVTYDDLREKFGTIGTVKDVHIDSNQRQPYALVTFTSEDDGWKAWEELNDTEWKGCKLHLRWFVNPASIPRDDHSASRSRDCYLCGQPGHNSYRCPTNRSAQKEISFDDLLEGKAPAPVRPAFRPPMDPTNRLVVFNLPPETTTESLKEKFASVVPEVVDAFVLAGRNMGFVNFKSPEDATSALSQLNGTDWDGQTLRMKYTEPREPRQSGGMGNRNCRKCNQPGHIAKDCSGSAPTSSDSGSGWGSSSSSAGWGASQTTDTSSGWGTTSASEAGAANDGSQATIGAGTSDAGVDDINSKLQKLATGSSSSTGAGWGASESATESTSNGGWGTDSTSPTPATDSGGWGSEPAAPATGGWGAETAPESKPQRSFNKRELDGTPLFDERAKGYKLVVFGVPVGTTGDELKEVFLKHATPSDCFVPPGKDMAFVTFEQEEDGKKAGTEVNGSFFKNSRLKVSWAKPRPGGGGGGGGGGGPRTCRKCNQLGHIAKDCNGSASSSNGFGDSSTSAWGTSTTDSAASGWGDTAAAATTSSGWGTESTEAKPADGGWGSSDSAETKPNDGGWGSSTTDGSPKNDGGWGSSDAPAAADSGGWGAESTPAALAKKEIEGTPVMDERAGGYKVIVFKVPDGTTSDEMRELFAKHAPVKDSFVPNGKGIAFVTFENIEDGQKAGAEVNNMRFKGRTLGVKWSTPRPGGGRPPRNTTSTAPSGGSSWGATDGASSSWGTSTDNNASNAGSGWGDSSAQPAASDGGWGAPSSSTTTEPSGWGSDDKPAEPNAGGWGSEPADASANAGGWGSESSAPTSQPSRRAPRPLHGTPTFDERSQGYKLFVSKFPASATSEELKAKFEKEGPVKDAFIPNGKPFGFVTYATQEEAEKAGLAMNFFDWNGSKLMVKWAEPPKNGGGGGPRKSFAPSTSTSSSGDAWGTSTGATSSDGWGTNAASTSTNDSGWGTTPSTDTTSSTNAGWGETADNKTTTESFDGGWGAPAASESTPVPAAPAWNDTGADDINSRLLRLAAKSGATATSTDQSSTDGGWGTSDTPAENSSAGGWGELTSAPAESGGWGSESSSTPAAAGGWGSDDAVAAQSALVPKKPVEGTPIFDDRAKGYKLVVFGFPDGTSNDELKAAFEKFAPVTDAFVLPGKTMGFVTFGSVEDGEKAGMEMHESRFKGRTIRLKWSQPRTGGGGGGGGSGPRTCRQCNQPGHIAKDCTGASNTTSSSGDSAWGGGSAGASAGGWGGTAASSTSGGGWGSEATETKTSTTDGGWGSTESAAPATDGGWGTTSSDETPKNDGGWGSSDATSNNDAGGGWGTESAPAGDASSSGWGSDETPAPQKKTFTKREPEGTAVFDERAKGYKLVVFKVPVGTSGDELKEVFAKHATPSDCFVPPGKDMAFVTFEQEEDGKKAGTEVNGSFFKNSRLKVCWAKPRAGGGGGGGGGGPRTCHKCNQPGHMARDCTGAATTSSSGGDTWGNSTTASSSWGTSENASTTETSGWGDTPAQTTSDGGWGTSTESAGAGGDSGGWGSDEKPAESNGGGWGVDENAAPTGGDAGWGSDNTFTAPSQSSKRTPRPLQGKPVYDERSGGYKLYVGKLPSGATVEELKAKFEKEAPVKDVFILSGRDMGFVTFEKQEDAEKAGLAMNFHAWNGNKLYVKWCEPKPGATGGTPTGPPKSSFTPRVSSNACRKCGSTSHYANACPGTDAVAKKSDSGDAWGSSSTATDSWGNSNAAADSWGAPAETETKPANDGGWGDSTTTENNASTGGGWGDDTENKPAESGGGWGDDAAPAGDSGGGWGDGDAPPAAAVDESPAAMKERYNEWLVLQKQKQKEELERAMEQEKLDHEKTLEAIRKQREEDLRRAKRYSKPIPKAPVPKSSLEQPLLELPTETVVAMLQPAKREDAPKSLAELMASLAQEAHHVTQLKGGKMHAPDMQVPKPPAMSKQPSQSQPKKRSLEADDPAALFFGGSAAKGVSKNTPAAAKKTKKTTGENKDDEWTPSGESSSSGTKRQPLARKNGSPPSSQSAEAPAGRASGYALRTREARKSVVESSPPPEAEEEDIPDSRTDSSKKKKAAKLATPPQVAVTSSVSASSSAEPKSILRKSTGLEADHNAASSQAASGRKVRINETVVVINTSNSEPSSADADEETLPLAKTPLRRSGRRTSKDSAELAESPSTPSTSAASEEAQGSGGRGRKRKDAAPVVVEQVAPEPSGPSPRRSTRNNPLEEAPAAPPAQPPKRKRMFDYLANNHAV